MAKDTYKYFRVESRELIEKLTRGILDLENGGKDENLVPSLLRFAHTLKGASRVVKQPAIAEAAHAVEEILSPYREGRLAASKEHTGEMLRLLDQITVKVAGLERPGLERPGLERPGLERPIEPGRAAPAKPRSEEPLETVRVEVEEVEALLNRLSEASVQITIIQNEIEKVRQAKQLSSLIVRRIHSYGVQLNGSAAGIGSLAEQLLAALESVERDLGIGVERAQRDLNQSWERANRLRLMPAATIFSPLARAIRDAAVALGKEVQFYPSGGHVRLDAHVLVLLHEALLHLVRNAVAHGIEIPEARVATGKPPSGRIDLSVQQRGSRVAFVCRDDGRGIDVEAIRRAAINKGIVAAAETDSLGLDQAIELILRGGVSTAGTVTGIAGRGVGLDVVRDVVTRLKGEISIESAPNAGTNVEIRVPVSMTSVAALMVDSAGVKASIALDCVREVLRLPERGIVASGAHESIPYQGQAIPFLSLSQALGRPVSSANPGERRSAVIVRSGPALAAIGVGALRGTSTVVVRSLSALAGGAPSIAGGSVDADGKPLLVLDSAGLVRAAQTGSGATTSADEVLRAPILIVDDSLTTRMVEQGLLEADGHKVELASSAEEALDKARTRRYGLFLVDVEMPGMNGFQFVARTRQDPVLRKIPAILVTSRNAPEDKRLGEEVGASAYIVKSEFDQAYFLQTIRKLTE
ncbi:MAG TPA: response regulator [Candidatus Sulfotelmatobacter sp.]|jgi:two-component system chemotaxis sensor kinase CheA